MSKPRDYQMFKQVADVIGEERATVELQKVINAGIVAEEDGDDGLIEMFCWGDSPQGHVFWSSIDNGENPDEVDYE